MRGLFYHDCGAHQNYFIVIGFPLLLLACAMLVVPVPTQGGETNGQISSSHSAAGLAFFGPRPPTGIFKNDADSQLYVKSYSGVLLGNQGPSGDHFWISSGSSTLATSIRSRMTSSLYMGPGPPSAPQRSDRIQHQLGVRYRLSPSLNIGSQLKQLEVSKASTLVGAQQQPAGDAATGITANYGLSAFSTEHFLTLGWANF